MAEGQQPTRKRPINLLSEDSQQTQRPDAQTINIAGGKALAEAVRTTLGPRGMDKLLVSETGDVVITNDGATILGEMDIGHQAAQMIVEVAEDQKEKVGDGTTTAAVLAGELLARAENLLEQDLHPRTIVEGYHQAAQIATAVIDEQTTDAAGDDDLLRAVAATSLTGKATGAIDAESLAEQVVAAVSNGGDDVSRDHVRLVTHLGSSSVASECRAGVVVVNDDQNAPIRDEMPRSIEDATVAVLDVAPHIYNSPQDKLDVTKLEFAVDSPDELDAIRDLESGRLNEYVDVLADAGVDVLFNRAGIHHYVADAMAKEGILVLEPLMKNAKDIVRATGAERVPAIADFEPSDLGRADYVGVEQLGDDYVITVEGGPGEDITTLYVRASTEHVIEELERAVDGALDVAVAAKDGVVPGGGCSELAIANELRDAATGIEGRQQLAVDAFADAVEALPRTLAANAGLNPIDALVDLRATFDAEGCAGIIDDGTSATVGDPAEAGIFEPANVKRKAIESATEAATMIARIDDVIVTDTSR